MFLDGQEVPALPTGADTPHTLYRFRKPLDPAGKKSCFTVSVKITIKLVTA